MGKDAVAILPGASLRTRSADTAYPFRQDSDFWYLTGFDHPDAIAVLRTDGGPAFTLFVQPRDPLAETWNGYRPGVEGALADFGADEAHPVEQWPERLAELIAPARRLYHVLGRDAALDARIARELESLRGKSKQGLAPADEIVDPRKLLHEMRLRKAPEEVAILRRAAAISAAARLARPGRYEYELEAELLRVFRGRGGSGPAYGSIVGGGRNAAILHYVTNDRVLEPDTLVLVDAGVELEGYASDVTRTYPVGGRFTGAGRAVYEVVLAAQKAALAEVRPGATLPAIHEAAVRVLIDGMRSLGLLTGTVDDRWADESFRRYYMHGTSHWLGLDVHDVGVYATGDQPRPLEPGMVFTVEPGLYVSADEQDEAAARYRGIGVRIEDDVVVTEDGCENLNLDIPKEIADVEAWMA